MRYGIHGANVGRLASSEGAEAVSAAIRRHRLESVWAWEQIAVPASFASPWPYSRDGRLATPDDVALMDPLVWLGWVGALAPEVNLATGVFLLALHDPITAAKAAATLDLLARERVILGVGAGWLKEEYDALAKDFSDRGKRTDESIAAIRQLWSQSPAAFSSQTVSFPALYCEPRPKRAIPIVIAGGSKPGCPPGRSAGGWLLPASERAGPGTTPGGDALQRSGRGP